MTEKPKSKAIALDFDGVIANSMPTQERAWRSAAREILGPPSAVEERIVRNLYEGKAGERMFDGVTLKQSERKALRKQKNMNWFSKRNQVEIFYGVTDILINLSIDFFICIATTADRDYVLYMLKREGLLNYIDHIVTDNDVSSPKPNPEMIYEIGRLTKTNMSNICMVGDTFVDMQMSRTAGCCFVLMQADQRPNTTLHEYNGEVASNWHELPRLVLSCLDSGSE